MSTSIDALHARIRALEARLDIEKQAALATRPGVLAAIGRAAAAEFGIPAVKLFGAGREPNLVAARWAAWLVAREWRGSSYPAIARAFGRDHTSVIHGVRLATARCATDPGYFAAVRRISMTLSQETE